MKNFFDVPLHTIPMAKDFNKDGCIVLALKFNKFQSKTEQRASCRNNTKLDV